MARPTAPAGFAAIRAALRATSSGAPRGRRRLGLLLLVSLPVLVQLVVIAVGGSARSQGFPQFAGRVTDIYLKFILPLCTIFLGTAVFGDEWAGGTSPYLVGVPIRRGALVVARWLAAYRRALGFVLPSLAAWYLVCMLPLEGALLHYLGDLGWVLLVASVLLGAYSALFVLFGLALRRAVMTALIYVFLFEVAAANLPQSFASISLGFHGRNALWQLTGSERFHLVTLDVGQVEPPSIAFSLLWVSAVAALALACGAFVLRAKESGSEGAASDAAAT